MATRRFWAWLGVFFILCVVAGWVVAPESNQGFASDAAVLAFVAAVAVAIERSIEIFWTVTSNREGLGGWWPLSTIRREFDRAEAEADRVLGAGFDRAVTVLSSARDALDDADERVEQFQRRIDGLQSEQARLTTELQRVRELAPGSARLKLVAGLADRGARRVRAATGRLEELAEGATEVADEARSAVDDALNLIATFDDNPARRLSSLVIGASLGAIVAGLLGLNVFAATLGGQPDRDAGQPGAGAEAQPGDGDGGGFLDRVESGLAGAAGIVLTGIILGFGAEPTHQVVKGLQRYKEHRTPTDDVPTDVANDDEPAVGVRQLVGPMDAVDVAHAPRVHRIRATH